MTRKRIKRPDSHRIASQGQLKVREQFENHGWLVDGLDGFTDFGEDQLVKIVVNNEVTGMFFLVQVKTSTNPKRLKKANAYQVNIKTAHIDLWKQKQVPVFLVLWVPPNQAGYWVEIHNYAQSQTEVNPSWISKDSLTVRIPLVNTFDHDGFRKFESTFKTWYLKFLPILAGAEGVPGKLEFDFSSDAIGKEAAASLDNFFKTGAATRIPSKYIKEFEAPVWFKWLTNMPSSGINYELEIKSNPKAEPRPIKLEFISKEDKITFDYIELRTERMGSEEITVSNEFQSQPFKIRIRSNMISKQTHLTITFNRHFATTKESLRYLKLAKFISTGCKLRAVFLQEEREFINMEIQDDGVQFDPKVLEFFEKLTFINDQLNTNIETRELDPEGNSIPGILNLYTIITTGKKSGTFSGVVTINMKRGGPSELMKLFGERDEAGLAIEDSNMEFELLGRSFSLGRFSRKFETMKIKGGKQLLESYATANKGNVDVEFIPGSSAKFEDIYFNWLPKNDSN